MVFLNIDIKNNLVLIQCDKNYMMDNALFGVIDYSDCKQDDLSYFITMSLDKFMAVIKQSAIEQKG